VSEPAFRLAVPADKPRILEIAAQVWEGDDYIPQVIDDWLAPGQAQLVVATLDDQLAALARYDRTFPGYAWFEGLRTDPAYQNRGLARALTGHLVDRARAGGVECIGLSTYFDNLASQKVSASYGFERVASFAYCMAEAGAASTRAVFSPEVEQVSVSEAVTFVASSEALRLGRGFLPHSWRFYPFARGPEIALGHMEHLLGVRKGGILTALLCIGDQTPHGSESFSIDFLAGAQEAAAVLVRHALSVARAGKYVEAMAPCEEGRSSVALPVLRDLGFEVWNDGAADVFVYEKDLRDV
jgi:GNAT superfamily N-acetyltransferase